MKNFYRSIVLFVMALVAVVCLSAQVQAKVVCFEVDGVAAAIGEACTEDLDCIDELLCNGIESCAIEGSATTGICEAGEDVVCEAGESCSEEASGTCVPSAVTPCSNDLDCADADFCTNDACDEGTCVNTDVDCEGDVCDPADGTCVECLIDDDCEEGETCDDNMCVADGCPEGTPEKVLLFDTDGDCLLNKDELKAYSASMKDVHKQQKNNLKNDQSADKTEYKLIKTNYSTK